MTYHSTILQSYDSFIKFYVEMDVQMLLTCSQIMLQNYEQLDKVY